MNVDGAVEESLEGATEDSSLRGEGEGIFARWCGDSRSVGMEEVGLGIADGRDDADGSIDGDCEGELEGPSGGLCGRYSSGSEGRGWTVGGLEGTRVGSAEGMYVGAKVGDWHWGSKEGLLVDSYVSGTDGTALDLLQKARRSDERGFHCWQDRTVLTRCPSAVGQGYSTLTRIEGLWLESIQWGCSRRMDTSGSCTFGVADVGGL